MQLTTKTNDSFTLSGCAQKSPSPLRGPRRRPCEQTFAFPYKIRGPRRGLSGTRQKAARHRCVILIMPKRGGTGQACGLDLAASETSPQRLPNHEIEGCIGDLATPYWRFHPARHADEVNPCSRLVKPEFSQRSPQAGPPAPLAVSKTDSPEKMRRPPRRLAQEFGKKKTVAGRSPCAAPTNAWPCFRGPTQFILVRMWHGKGCPLFGLFAGDDKSAQKD